MKFSLICFSLFISTFVLAQVKVPYHKLQLLEITEFESLLHKQADIAKKEGHYLPIQEAGIKLLSRPDEDARLHKVFPLFKTYLNRYNAFEKSIEYLVNTSIAHVKEDKLEGDILTTHVFILINILSELKPGMMEKHPFSEKIYRKVKKADLEISEKIKKEFRLRYLKGLKSPSEIASSVIELAYATPTPTPKPSPEDN